MSILHSSARIGTGNVLAAEFLFLFLSSTSELTKFVSSFGKNVFLTSREQKRP